MDGTKKRMTKNGLKTLLDNIQELKKERAEALSAMETAREHGDLRENAEYHTARSKVGQVDEEIARIETVISQSTVMEEVENKKYIDFYAHVTMKELNTGDVVSYRIVGDEESDVSNGLISEDSPLGQLMMGKKKDDIIETPSKSKKFQILKISYE